MRKDLRVFILTGCLAVASSAAWGQARKFSNEFLSIGVGTRALGMSNAVVASTSDVTSGYWNPAGLTQITSTVQGSLMHAEYFAGIANFDYGAVAIPLESGVLGLSVIRFGVDDIQNTIDLIDPTTGQPDYSRITKFSTADYAGLVSYAKKLGIEGLSLGGSAKIIYRQIGDFAEAWGFGAELGAQYRTGNWYFGAMARDLTSTYNAWTYTIDDRTEEVFIATGNELPENALEITLPRLLLGAGYKFFLFKNNISVLPELNVDVTFDGQRPVVIQGDPASVDPYFGVETSYREIIYLRGGIGNIQREKAEIGNFDVVTFQPNFGVGLQLKNLFGVGSLAIDYALTDIGDQSGTPYSNVFSLRFDVLLNKQ